ncbi:unnamed protein product [Sphenostylis stenocarpa]|uniref:MATH domain-containing protein n=1 Tax=Sphenostylis stenocarpa TaxID=92480 RepID=A0AA86SUZ9_9FABA|nr:unnamed protein product [Sphenostylis stenocarpa]
MTVARERHLRKGRVEVKDPTIRALAPPSQNIIRDIAGHIVEVRPFFHFISASTTGRHYSVGKERRFHQMKKEWGIDQFIPLRDFNLVSKGYLVDDTCSFGAEVFVCKDRNRRKGESLVMMKDVIPYKHLYEFDNLSHLNSECCDSKPFNAGNFKWKIKLYPNGKGAELGNYLSLYLAFADPSTLSPTSKIYAQIALRILDQKQAKHHFGKANYWFSASSPENGAPRFMPINSFTNQNSGYLVKESCLVEAEVMILGVVDDFSKIV